MRIGIDFDNTLVNYDQLFIDLASERGIDLSQLETGKLSKALVRKAVMDQSPDGDTEWQRFQGVAYGPRILEAVPMGGARDFLFSALALNHDVFLVSHKTEFASNGSARTSLRDAARKWLAHNGFLAEYGRNDRASGFDEKNIHFASSREEKVAIIAQLECDYFVDDLIEVFLEPEFPVNTTSCLFDPSDVNTTATPQWNMTFRSWLEASDTLLDRAPDLSLCRDAIGSQIQSIDQHRGGGNNRIYHVVMKNSRQLAIKDYRGSDDAITRVTGEWDALSLLGNKLPAQVPLPISRNHAGTQALYSWIDGTPITHIEDQDVRDAVEFTRKLHALSKVTSANSVGGAKEACLSLSELSKQIQDRIQSLVESEHRTPGLEQIVDKIRQLTDAFTSTAKNELAKHDIGQNDSLSFSEQTLSPSDFGFHNALRRGDGSLAWVDFEYFGWDDPVKLISDFIWHPGMKLSESQKALFLDKTLELFSARSKTVRHRFEAYFPLFGLRWCLIILNVFKTSTQERINFATSPDNIEIVKTERLLLARSLLNEISTNCQTDNVAGFK